MKKYYIGLAILFALTVGVVIYVAMQAGASKEDKKTADKFDEIANKLDEISYQGSRVPASLDELEVKDIPPTITYQKIDDETYKICTTYNTQSNYLDGGLSSILWGTYASAGDPYYYEGNQDEPKEYLDRTQIWYHKSGQNCQTVKPIGIYSDYPGVGTSNPACDYSDSEKIYGKVIVESVDTSSKTVSFSPNGQSLYDENGQKVTETIDTKSYDDNTAVCDYYDPKIRIEYLEGGMDVDISLDSVDDPILNRIDVNSSPPNGL